MTVTLAIGPAVVQRATDAPSRAAISAAASQGTPATSPDSVSAAASAAASTAARTAWPTTSTTTNGSRSAVSSTTAPRMPTASTDPEPRSRLRVTWRLRARRSPPSP
ncbi:hypothetical protein QN345_15525 [Cryobacterium sp. 10I1]|nr:MULTISPECIES: hypothetical protein [unclassified Cryobacterium]MEB0002772.1 hypothetical protein [Cryobacterium sp. RTC2.1]MEB0201584.1 hypothetical protein [Cryobacterium sp. 5I3]MEB0285017.1 hypothetical protein [Cryobacterium sp. 10S3]MEB0306710.1 hypothetical protein [Cryobacterium sp. 10I1]WPX13977.1 hypothetical protein RHM57_00965 [Cryobacterium sp. 10S3]